MKNLIFILIGIPFFFSSCAVHNGLTTNTNVNTTEVVLSQSNFKVIESVKGESQAVYVFGMGGLSRSGMIAEARARMLANAGLVGSSRAIINETVEVKHSFFPIVRTYKVTVSGYVIEFAE